MLNRVLLAAAMSWIYSVTLGLLFAACASGRLSFIMLPYHNSENKLSGTAGMDAYHSQRGIV